MLEGWPQAEEQQVEMSTRLTQEEVLASISPLFHAEYAWLKDAHLQPSEPVFAAADVGGELFGFAVVTSSRVLAIQYRTSGIFEASRAKTPIYREGGGFFDKVAAVYSWYDLSPPLSRSEIRSRKVADWRLDEFARDLKRREYVIRLAKHSLKLVELRMHLGWGPRYVFKEEAGKTIYDLIQVAAQNQGWIPPEETAPDHSSSGLIDALARLHQAGVLTDQEFEQKKKELLNRLS